MKLKSWIATAGIAAVGVGLCVPQASAQKNNQDIPAGDWRTINRDLASDRFSPLTQINTGNVANLKEAWTYQLTGTTEQVPLVVNGVMFVTSGGKVAARQPGDGGLKVIEDAPGSYVSQRLADLH